LKILAFYEKACCNRRRLMGKMIADLNSITTTTTTTIKHTHTIFSWFLFYRYQWLLSFYRLQICYTIILFF